MKTVIEEKRVKDKCQTFTPPQIVKQLLRISGIGKTDIVGKRFLENSCGNGAILSYIVETYIQNSQMRGMSNDDIAKSLFDNIYAFEIDKKLIKECKERLDTIALKFGIHGVQWNIRQVDFLSAKISCSFDYIIGNPPYIAYPDLPKSTREFIGKKFETCQNGKWDYNYAFIERSYKVLSDKGTLTYIIPSNIFKNVFAENLRELIKGDLISIVDYPKDNFFEGVLVSPAIINVKKNSCEGKLKYHVYNIGKKVKTITINKSCLGSKWVFQNKENTNGVRVGDYFKVSSSIATLYNDAFLLRGGVLKEGFYLIDNEKIEEGIIRRTTSPKSKRNGIDNEFIIYPYYYEGNKICRYLEAEVKSRFPYAYEYLSKFKNRLLQRDSDKNASWYEFGRSQALQHMNQPMILISSIISEKTKAYLLKDEIPYSGLYIVPTKDTYSLEHLLELLNSKDFKEYISKIGVCVCGNSKRISPKDIENYFCDLKS